MEDLFRKKEEIDFHNQRERDRQSLEQTTFLKKYSNKKYYSITRQSKHFVSQWLAQHCNGKEALGHNPIIRLYRKRTPHLRTAWEIDHILKIDDIKLAGQDFGFGSIIIHYFHLFSILGVLFRKTPLFNPVLTMLEAIDSLVLKIPYLNLMAWQAVFELSTPKKVTS